MTLLITCQNLSKSYGPRVLFREISFGVFSGERLAIIGVNGSGKSSLLKIIAGLEKADDGQVVMRQQLRVGYVPQEAPFMNVSLHTALWEELEGDLREDYEKEVAIEVLLGKMGFDDPLVNASTLSGGWRKRLEIAKQLIKEPDLLLLDEPTNHLDLDSILWLEKFLLRQSCAYIVVSHDRAFLSEIAEHTLELGKQYPDGIFKVDAPYDQFLELRKAFLEGQLEMQKSLASKVRWESAWLKSNPKARTTKSQARVEQAEQLIQDLQDLKTRNKKKEIEVDFSATERETRKLLVAKNISYQYGEKTLFQGLDCTLSPRTRLGLMGPNGSGKTTLLRLLAQELQPKLGTIKLAEGAKIVYFDQHRFALPQQGTLRTALSPCGDYVKFQGREIHVNGWCQRFLFTPELLDMPLHVLSGGEKARLLIAKLMLQPADILLLDEPTNDLDIPTLEILEENLLEFPGAIVLITHDRQLLSRVCNQVLGLGLGPIPLAFPDYHQWKAYQEGVHRPTTRDEIPAIKPEPQGASGAKAISKGSWKERKELAEIEQEIPNIEENIASLQLQLEDPALSSDSTRLQALCKKLSDAQKRLDTLYHRWGELA